MFGIAPNGKVPFYWGGQALYNSSFKIELLTGFESWNGECTAAQKERLLGWLHTTGLKLLRKQVKQDWIGIDENRLVSVKDPIAGYMVQANPKGTRRYLYICASEIPR